MIWLATSRRLLLSVHITSIKDFTVYRLQRFPVRRKACLVFTIQTFAWGIKTNLVFFPTATDSILRSPEAPPTGSGGGLLIPHNAAVQHLQ